MGQRHTHRLDVLRAVSFINATKATKAFPGGRL